MKLAAEQYQVGDHITRDFPYCDNTFVPNATIIEVIDSTFNKDNHLKIINCGELDLAHPGRYYKFTSPEEWENTRADIIHGQLGKYDYEWEYFNKSLSAVYSPKRHFFPLYFLYHTFHEVIISSINQGTTFNGFPKAYSYPTNIHFLCYNRNTRPHRVALLQLLKDRGMLTTKNYSFWGEGLEELIMPHRDMFKYSEVINLNKFTIKTNFLDSKTEVHKTYFNFTEEFLTSAFQLVSETCDERHFWTEKTWYPILCSKPFITHGSQYINKSLTDFGFVLYDDIFDYSFDNEPDPGLRAKMLADEVNRVVKTYDYNYITKKLKDKCKHNYNNAIDILSNKKFIPSIFLKWNDQYKHLHVWRNHSARWYSTLEAFSYIFQEL